MSARTFQGMNGDYAFCRSAGFQKRRRVGLPNASQHLPGFEVAHMIGSCLASGSVGVGGR
jgi:hypothetical protein